MAHGYAVGPVVFVMGRALNHLPGLDHLSVEAGSYSVIFYALVSIVFADLIVDWTEIAAGRGVCLGKAVSVKTAGLNKMGTRLLTDQIMIRIILGRR